MIAKNPACQCVLSLRNASLADLNAIMQIESQGFIPQIQEERSVFEQRIRQCPALFLIFADNSTGKVAGYLSAEYMEKIPTCAAELALGHTPGQVSKSAKSYLYISSFSLLPEYRGGGLGKQAWTMAMEYFTCNLGAKNLLLLVNELWKGAMHIYQAAGFKELAVFKEFFPTEREGIKSAGILMEKTDK